MTVFLDGPVGPVFSGERVPMTIDAYGNNAKTPRLVATATVDFGDRSVGMATGSCAAPAAIEHVYQRGGRYVAKVIAATTCEAAPLNQGNASGTFLVFPSASAASASWPTRSTFQLRLTGHSLGAAMGTLGDVVSLRNVSGHGCQLEGYPGLQLVAADGRLLPTTVRAPSEGAMLFPASAPHRVALGPGDDASFELDWQDNPSGAAINEPYSVACPSSAYLRVILPAAHQYGTATIPMAPCGGGVDVSPLLPGATGFDF